MLQGNSKRVSKAKKSSNSHLRFIDLLSDHPIIMAATILMLAACFNIPSKVYAQDAASCIDKCKSDEKVCLHNGSSEELCDYDSKQCQKACKEKGGN
ncbi:MAG TPA: hypothetical protein VME69_09805 [Methylocella sp.]|nr:hypothetical protein [Methylocella sp.]